MGFPRVTRQHESEQRRRAMKGLVLIPNVVKRRWHQHILHVHYARRLRLQLLDVLAPGIGEIIGDSQREERLDVLDARMTGARRRRSTTPGTGICAATARCRTPASAWASSAPSPMSPASPTCAMRSRSRERREARGIEATVPVAASGPADP